MKGIILAAGKGKRLRPLTDNIPKPLIKIGEITVLDRIIQGMLSIGINQIAIITNYLENKIIQHLKNNTYNAKIIFFHQDVPKGTGHALLPAFFFLHNTPFFLNYGDIVVDPVNYSTIADCFRRHPSDSIIGSWLVSDPSSGGVLISEGNHLVDIIEKPSNTSFQNVFINAGLMVLQPDIFKELYLLKKSKRGELELTDAIKALAKYNTVRTCPLSHFWSDIGTPEKLKEARKIFSQKL